MCERTLLTGDYFEQHPPTWARDAAALLQDLMSEKRMKTLSVIGPVCGRIR